MPEDEKSQEQVHLFHAVAILQLYNGKHLKVYKIVKGYEYLAS